MYFRATRATHPKMRRSNVHTAHRAAVARRFWDHAGMSRQSPDRLRAILFRALRVVFRALPLPTATRDRWRARFLDRRSHWVPRGPRGVLASEAAGLATPVRAGHAAIGHVPYRQADLPSPLPATLVAFYLPQFHPIPENDAWWGKGFTEWRNVARALPQFEGHDQPRLPADLGFYDLRDGTTMREQARLAREYGIGAFCFYFYWFGGRTLLETPLRQWLADASIDLPFCLCWANENWSRRWDGRGDDILISQQHGPQDDLAFIAHVADYLRDPRALRVEGKPLLLVYRPGLLPDARATALRWREWCRQHGVGDIHLAYVQSFERPDPADIGFDSAVEFPPNLSQPQAITAQQRLLNPEYAGDALDWRTVAAEASRRPLPDYTLFPGVNPGWDNEPRRPGKGRVYLHASPRGYRDWLHETVHRRLATAPASRRLVFINAWNEWAEGAVLEPDARLGHAWLEATRQGLQPRVSADARPCAVVHAWHLDVFDELLAQLRASGIDWRVLVTTPPERAEGVRTCLDRLGFKAEVVLFENRGRDILPFLHVANRLLDEGTEVVLKLHTKRSIHLDNGDAWRQDLLARLLAPRRAGHLLSLFGEDPALGLIAPEGHLQPLAHFQGANEARVQRLATRMGVPAPSGSTRFVSGSMFWVRLQALRPLLDAHLDPQVFEPEQGQLDGTCAHAIERVFALAVEAAGYRVETAADACGEPDAGVDIAYPYARRDL